MAATIAQILWIVAVILWIVGLVFLLGVLFPIFPKDPLVSIACFLAAYTLKALA